MASEKRLIDAKKALYLAEHSGLYDLDLSALETLLFDEPCISVDAVEVVRCKDCKHWNNPYCNHSESTMLDTQADDFCSYGERRTDD